MNKVSIFVTVGVLFLAGFGVLLFSNSSTGSKESGKVFPQAQLSLVKENFSALEPVVLTVDLKKEFSKPQGFWPTIIKKVIAASEGPVSATVEDPEGKETDAIPVDIDEKGDGVYEIKALPPVAFVPGKYTMKVLLSEGLAKRTITQDFTWGVLSINPNKSVYTTGDTARLAMAVLDEQGEMVCDADLSLTITDPKGESKIMDVKTSSIRVNPVCYKKEFTLEPDYEARYTTTVPGEYKMTLKAITKNGSFSINDAFRVEDMPIFDIERSSITRVFPAFTYPMSITVKANRDFEGEISELVPDNFTLRPMSSAGGSQDTGVTNLKEPIIDDTLDTSYTELVWDVSIKKGETVRLGYGYMTPPISPQFYLLGPLAFMERGAGKSVVSPAVGSSLTQNILYHESRQWQLAIDQDGSGTMSVSPTTGDLSTTGNTYTFTYTSGESVATGSGAIQIQVPSSGSPDWSTPQGTAGVAGYTTALGNTTATVADVLNGNNVVTGWAELDADMCNAFDVSTLTPMEGSSSILCDNNPTSAGPDNNDAFQFDYGADQNWATACNGGACTQVSYWIRRINGTSGTAVAFTWSSTTDLTAVTGQIGECAVPATTSSGVWYYATCDLSGTLTTVRTYGFACTNNTCDPIETGDVYIDEMLIGPGVPTFSGRNINVRILDIGVGETITVTYGAGGGASGVTNSSSYGPHTFTTLSKISAHFMNSLVNISSSPTVTIGEANSLHMEGLNMELIEIN